MRHIRHPQKGSLILVVLCLLAVLGIGLAAFLAVGDQSMKLSNRSFQTGLSSKLAEMGLEEALRAFNTNNWATWGPTNGTTATWSISGNTASCTITFPSTKYGNSGVTGLVKIRVDNYNAYYQSSTWNSSTTYQKNDLVGNSGTWYRAVQSNTNQTPGDLAYWVPAPIPWTWNSNLAYPQYRIVNYNGTWYRCHTATTSGILPTNTAYWSYIPKLAIGWISGTSYPVGTMLYDSGIWCYCIKLHTSSASITTSNTTYWAQVVTATGTVPGAGVMPTTTYFIGETFAVGDYIYRAATPGWYRSLAAQTYVSGDYANTSKWATVSNSGIPYIFWAWRSGVTYSFNDLVYYSGSWYRCKIASASSTPTTATDWENVFSNISGSWSWSSSASYYPGNVVYRSGSFYRCILEHTNQTPPNATYWSTAPLLPVAWDPGKSYGQYATVYYNGSWYLSIQASNAGNNPATNSSWWAIAPRSLAAWDSTKSYSIDNLVSYSGTWYRCIKNHSNQTPTNTTYWVAMTGSAYQWNATTAYNTTSYVNYDGVWYQCATANTGNTPNNATYWTALGAPVVYAEGTATLPDGSAPIKTQLRATVAPAPLFPNAVAATSTLTISGAGTVDSYDGALSAINTDGTYSTQTYNQITSPFSASSPNLGYSAVLTATGTTNPAVTVTSTTVKGYVAAPSASTTPYAPLWTYGGSAALTGSSATGIDLTRVSRSPYIPQLDTQSVIQHTNIPTTLPSATYPTLNLGAPGAPTPSVYTYASDLTLPANTTININGPVILDIQGGLNLWNAGTTLNIAPTGSAEIHLSGRLLVTTGNGIVNLTKDPKKLILICTGNAGTSFYSTTANTFYGTIYMPNNSASSAFTIGTGVINGALSAQNVTFSGAANLDYDTSLRYATFGGVDACYVISEWRELTDPNERAVLP
jgi:hypothetical protein